MPPPTDLSDRILKQWAQERPDLDDSGLGIALRIGRLGSLYASRLKRLLEPHGLAPWEFDVLSALRRHGARSSLSAAELCTASQLTSGAMTHRLDRLEERGWIARGPDPDDRRGVRVSLTASGKATIERVMQARANDAAEATACLSRADRRQLSSLLRALCLEEGDV